MHQTAPPHQLPPLSAARAAIGLPFAFRIAQPGLSARIKTHS